MKDVLGFGFVGNFFGLNFQPDCISSKAVFENNQYKAALVFSNSGRQQSIMIVQKTGDFPYIERDPLLKVYLPKEQSVFRSDNSYYRYFGANEKSVSFHSEVLDEKTGKYRPVTVTLSSDHNPIITTEYEGEIFLDILSGF